MSLQKLITDRYMSLNNQPTLKSIAKDTGVQITRAYRILNGASMKVSEYEVFKERIHFKMKTIGEFEKLATECSLRLPKVEIEELIASFDKKLKLNSYKGEE